jgi:hypothetical protein
MTLNTKILVAGVALAASLAAVSPASAAVIVKPITGGTYTSGPYTDAFQVGDLGTIAAIRLLKTNTYDFTFTIAPFTVSVLTQIQASLGGPQDIGFKIFSGTPTHPTGTVDTSPVEDGPSLTDRLGLGKYFIQVDHIAKNNELLTGGLDVNAVPEPMAWALMVVGFVGIGAALRRRQANPASINA